MTIVPNVIVLSGGMDSAVLSAYLKSEGRPVHALSFDYGSKHAAQELVYAEVIAAKYCLSHEIVRLPFVSQLFKSALLMSGEPIPDGHYEDESMRATVVPFRNAIMLAIAVGYSDSIGSMGTVYIGSHSGDHAIYPDCRHEFREAMSIAATLGTYGHVQIEAPFELFDKRRIAVLGKNLALNFSETWTCYKGGAVHCGTCGSCTERIEALQGFDTTEYLTR